MENKATLPCSEWRNNENLGQIAVVVCTETHTFAGFTYCAYGQRLLDALNEGLPIDSWRIGKYFLALTEVEVFLPDAGREDVASTYIRKSNILFVCGKSETQFAARGSRFSDTTYPFRRRKKSVPVIVRYPSYTLLGKMHNDVFEKLMDTLEGEDSFLPVTNVEILPGLVSGESKFDFVAVNKDKIVYVAELSPRPPELSA